MGVTFKRKLLETFGEDNRYRNPHRLPLAEEDAKEVAKLVKIAKDGLYDRDLSWSEKDDLVNVALEAFSKAMGGYGVEGLDPQYLPDRQRRNWKREWVSYANRGDTYDCTLLFDWHHERFYVSSWGDHIELLERQAYREGILEKGEDE